MRITTEIQLLGAAVFLASIGYSSQANRNFDEDHDPVPPSSVISLNPADRTAAEDHPLRARSRSPTNRLPPIEIFGYSLDKLGYMRLTSRTNPDLRLEFRSYVFTADQPLRLLSEGKKFTPVPKQEQIVLSACNGEIFALLEYGGFLRAIHLAEKHNPRVKIDMKSGAVNIMTPDEKRDCPVGRNHKISSCYMKSLANNNTLQMKENPFIGSIPESSSSAGKYLSGCNSTEEPPSRARSRSPTDNLPPIRVLGYSLQKLGFIRLISRRRENIQFEFRNYVFPADKPIRLRTEKNRFTTISTREQIVVSASNGDIYAILEYAGFLRAIYKAAAHNPRVKINMMSGAVDIMTPDEMKDCPVGKTHSIFRTSFIKGFADHSSLQFEENLNA